MKCRKRLLAAGAAALLSITGAWSAETPGTNEATVPPVNALAMMAVSIPCADLDRSIDFYTKGLGMTLRGRVEMGNVIEAPIMFPGGGAYLLLQHPKAEGAPLPIRGPLNRIGLIVPDLKALEAQLKTAGYQLKGPIQRDGSVQSRLWRMSKIRTATIWS